MDNHFIRQGIDLKANVRFFPPLCMLDLFIYHIDNPVLKTFRSNQQKVRLLHCFSLQQCGKDIRCLFSDPLICRNQRQIRIQGGRFFIIIAGSDLRDIGNTIIHPS